MEKRIVSLCCAVVLGLMALMLRIAVVGGRVNFEAARSQRTKTVQIGSSRGKIYDRNFSLLVDREERLVCAAVPSLEIYGELSVLYGEKQAAEKIKSGKPIVFSSQTEINSSYARTFAVPVRYGEKAIAEHLVGYLDKSGQNGLSGIERAYNAFLKENGGELSVSFETDALGKALLGVPEEVNDSNFNSKAGVALTLDSEIQSAAERALSESSIKSGCALVMHVDTGEISAMASVPEFDRVNPANSLSESGSPFVNKALQSYCVGSVFKPLVAAAALENGISEDYEYECRGSEDIAGTVFRCFGNCAHGKQNMKQALENSCNTYFIDLLSKTDPELLLSLCRTLGFSSETPLCGGISAQKGRLPESEDLFYPGERANLAFGQGKLLATPIQLLSAYHALATGKEVRPTVLLGLADSSGELTEERREPPRPVLKKSTVLKMREMLSSVVENGNAEKARSSLVSLAGKTGTAQSGIFNGKDEVCRTWFCGFFPAENPHYIAVILNEDGSSGSADCAPVFKRLCEAVVKGE